MIHRAAVAVTLLAFAAPALAQANPRGEAKADWNGKAVVIAYGRPSLKGRDMLGQAQVGQEWRMGADAATTLVTAVDLAFGKVQVPKGEYVLAARRTGADQWLLMVKKKDRSVVAEVPLEATTLEQPVEEFTIELKEDKGQGLLRLLWGNRALNASFTPR